MKDLESTGALTKPEDWNQYYEGRHFNELEKAAHSPSIIDHYLTEEKQRVFELGCGGSGVIARCALLGWDVGGIDFNPEALWLVKQYLSKKKCPSEDLVCGDVYTYDCSIFNKKFDFLISLGFLEHFGDPQVILAKWRRILNSGGKVITVIPNLFSINAFFFEKYDTHFYRQHIRYLPEDMDRFHLEAGLVPLEKAHYYGKYDIHMLIPWGKICEKIGNRFVFRMIKYMASCGGGILTSWPPMTDSKLLSPLIVGIYALQCL